MNWLYSWHFVIPFLALCLLVFYEDLKYRAIHVMWPLLIFFLAIVGWASAGFLGFTDAILFNLLYLNILYSSLLIYLAIKGHGIKEVFKNKIGTGDLAISYSLSFYFLPTVLMVFFPLVCILSLALYQIPRKKKTIPLAGFLCISAFIWVLVDPMHSPVSKWLLKIL